MMSKAFPSFGTFCMDHSQRYGGQIIDKIVISYKVGMVLPTRDKPCCPGAFQEFQYGDNLQLHIGGERIDPTWPMAKAVYDSLSPLVMNERYFTKAVKTALEPFFTTTYTHDLLFRFIQTLELLGFSLGQLELAFDIGQRPALEGITGNAFKDTYYSDDFSRKARIREENDSGPRRVDRQDSMLCIYDRARKLGVGKGVYRLEIRIKQNHRSLLEMSDLILDMERFVMKKGPRIRDIVSKHVPDMTDSLGKPVLMNFPLLAYLIPVRQMINGIPASTNFY